MSETKALRRSHRCTICRLTYADTESRFVVRPLQPSPAVRPIPFPASEQREKNSGPPDTFCLSTDHRKINSCGMQTAAGGRQKGKIEGARVTSIHDNEDWTTSEAERILSSTKETEECQRTKMVNIVHMSNEYKHIIETLKCPTRRASIFNTRCPNSSKR